MKRTTTIMTLAYAIVLAIPTVMGTIAWPAQADDDGSVVTIISPQPGQVFAEDLVDVRFELTKGSKAYHAHVFLDGTYLTAFHSPLTGLSMGTHELTVVAATAQHQLLQASDTVRFRVK